jgi:aldehyde:ferredoxin oxidoreductase
VDTIIRINLSLLSTRLEPVPARWRGLGGRGLTSTIVTAEVPPSCHPLGENNKLVFAPGAFTGTLAADNGGLSIGGKSPLTGGIKVNNSGGSAGRLLAQLGIKALILEGLPKNDKWYNIHINKDGATLQEESELIGKGNFEVIEAVEARRGKEIGMMTIGTAGEMKMVLANISLTHADGTIRSHVCGGLGAVLGSKRIKFISIEARGGPGVRVAEPVEFRKAARTFAKAMLDHKVTGQALPACGTADLLDILARTGGLPIQDFTARQLARHETISGRTMLETVVAQGGGAKHDCHDRCVEGCSQDCCDANEAFQSPIECKARWGLGAACCIGDLADVAMADCVMDDLGVDSHDTALMFGVAMEAGILPFGDGKGVCRILKDEIGKGTPLGRILGGGTSAVGKAHGLTCVPVNEELGTRGFEPRALNVTGIRKDGQTDILRKLQIATAAVDSSGMNRSIAFLAMDCPECLRALIDMLNARSGLVLTRDDVAEFCKHILRAERNFNVAAGFKQNYNCLPESLKPEAIEPNMGEWDFSGKKIEEFWKF